MSAWAVIYPPPLKWRRRKPPRKRPPRSLWALRMDRYQRRLLALAAERVE